VNLFPLNKNTLALIVVAAVGIGFFVAGLFEVLDYFIFQVLIFLGYGVLIIMAVNYGIKNDKKNRPEDELQDDSN
jgi:hypothetical protein